MVIHHYRSGKLGDADPAHRFALRAAVLGAKVLNWPQERLPVPG